MIVINFIFWIFLSSGFLALRQRVDESGNDLILSNEFIPTHYDVAFSFLIIGLMTIWLWNKLALQTFNTWELLSLSPIQQWMIRHLSIWLYAYVAIALVPQLALLIALPGLYMMENLQVHIGDIFMPPVAAVTNIVVMKIF